MPALDLSGVVAATMVIAGLGVLNDVTVTQASAVWELRALRPAAARLAVFASAMRIGRDHIASSVYTLVFAYAGTAMTVLLLITAYQRGLADVATAEEIAQEIVRTLVGAIGLVLAVPITTALAGVHGPDSGGRAVTAARRVSCAAEIGILPGIAAWPETAIGSPYPHPRGFMTDDDIGEGWYTDAYGAIRWWDGTQWTEHVRDPRRGRAHGGPPRRSSGGRGSPIGTARRPANPITTPDLARRDLRRPAGLLPRHGDRRQRQQRRNSPWSRTRPPRPAPPRRTSTSARPTFKSARATCHEAERPRPA